MSCSSCDKAKWGTQCPLPGVLLMTRDDSGHLEIERCDECGIFPADDEAQDAFLREYLKRSEGISAAMGMIQQVAVRSKDPSSRAIALGAVEILHHSQRGV